VSKINGNSSTLQNLRYSRETNRKLEKDSRKLSSGSRITSASDDAAGLSIVTNMDSKTRSKQVAARNATDGVSVMQIMDGTLNEMNGMVIRLRELAVAAASDTYSDSERSMTNLESVQLLDEIDRQAKTSEYLGYKLFKGESKQLDIQVDTDNSSKDRISINLEDLAQTPYALGISDVRLDSKHQARLSLLKIDHAQNEINRSRAIIGATSNRLNAVINKLGSDVTNGKAAESRIRDVDYAQATAENAANKIKQSAQTSVQVQTNKQSGGFLKLL
jgi:flagellin